MNIDHKHAFVGEAIIELLQLNKKRNGRIDTVWGDKTNVGLYLTVKRAIKEAENQYDEDSRQIAQQWGA